MYYQVCSNFDPVLILAFISARSNLLPDAIVIEVCALASGIIVVQFHVVFHVMGNKGHDHVHGGCILHIWRKN